MAVSCVRSDGDLSSHKRATLADIRAGRRNSSVTNSNRAQCSLCQTIRKAYHHQHQLRHVGPAGVQAACWHQAASATGRSPPAAAAAPSLGLWPSGVPTRHGQRQQQRSLGWGGCGTMSRGCMCGELLGVGSRNAHVWAAVAAVAAVADQRRSLSLALTQAPACLLACCRRRSASGGAHRTA